MKSSISLEIYRNIAKELGLSVSQVEEVCLLSMECQYYIQTKLVDRDNDVYPSLRIPGFGMFYKNQKRISSYKSMKRKKENEGMQNM